MASSGDAAGSSSGSGWTVLASYFGRDVEKNLPEKPDVGGDDGSVVVRVVAQSDTHNRLEARTLQGDADSLPAVPAGDVYVHAGDFSMTGTVKQTQNFHVFVAHHLPEGFQHKVVIAGNHDVTLEPAYYARVGQRRFHREPEDCDAARAVLEQSTHLTYLQDSACELDFGGGAVLKVWGAPWQPEFCDWAFNLERGPELEEKWALIPEETDLLITHGGPAHYGAHVSAGDAGCDDLWARVQVVKPAVHVFGHVHEDYGIFKDRKFGCPTLFVNASTCTQGYSPTNPSCVIDLQYRP